MSADLTSLRNYRITKLVHSARKLGLDNAANLSKQDLIFEISRRKSGHRQPISGTGVLEILPDGFGFLRSPDANYLPGADDIYVSPSQIRKFNLRTGDLISGNVRAPKEGERYFALIKIEQINDRSPDVEREKMLFDNLTAVPPTTPLLVGGEAGVLDSWAPLACGQRIGIFAPQRAGTQRLLNELSQHWSGSHTVLLLMLDEHPEVLTELQRTLSVELISSTMEESPTRHVEVAQMALARARRLTEQERDVILIVNSLSRLARAFHAANDGAPSALGSQAIYRTRQYFSSGRQFEEGGSLTMVGTVDVGPGLHVDPELNSALCGVASAQLWLSSDLHKKGLYPAIDLSRSFVNMPERYLSEDAAAALQKRCQGLSGDNHSDLLRALNGQD